MDKISLQTNYEHKNLVNNPPFITNHPLTEKLGLCKKEIRQNETDLFKSEYAKDKKDNGFIWTCVLGAVIAVTATAVYIYKKLKAGLKIR